MAIGLSDTIRAAQANDIKNAVDAQTPAGTIKVYNGTRPAKGGAVTTLLCTFTLNKPSFTQSNGVLTLIVSPAIADNDAANTGTATWARIADGTGTFVADMGVGGGAELTLDNYNITQHGIVNLTSGTITVGNI